jgi:hypothetical protein
MRIGRSTFYDTPDAGACDLTIVAEMKTICDEFEVYGYRRVGAELRHRGIVVNAKKIRRLMREHALNPKQSGWYRCDMRICLVRNVFNCWKAFIVRPCDIPVCSSANCAGCLKRVI